MPKKKNNEDRVNGLAAWLEKLGVPKKWAIAIAILIIAGGVAATSLIGGCGVMDFNIRGAGGGSLSVEQDQDGKIIVVGQRPIQLQK